MVMREPKTPVDRYYARRRLLSVVAVLLGIVLLGYGSPQAFTVLVPLALVLVVVAFF